VRPLGLSRAAIVHTLAHKAEGRCACPPPRAHAIAWHLVAYLARSENVASRRERELRRGLSRLVERACWRRVIGALATSRLAVRVPERGLEAGRIRALEGSQPGRRR